MLSTPIYSGSGFTGSITDKEFKDVLGSAGKCIMLIGASNLVIERCQMDNFSKAAIHLQNCSDVSIKDIYADAKLNATQDFCKGMMFENTNGISVDGFICKNIEYGGTGTYKNGDAFLVESGTGITLRRFSFDNIRDGGIDTKVHITIENGTIKKAHRGIRVWQSADIKDVSISDCDEGIWLADTATKVRLTRVSFANCTRKISDDNGNEIPLTDPRIEVLDSASPVIVPPTYTGPGVTPAPIPTPIPPAAWTPTPGIGWQQLKGTELYRIPAGDGKWFLTFRGLPVPIYADSSWPGANWINV